MSLTLVIIAVTALISWQALENRDMFFKLLHSPYQEVHRKEWYRILTSTFVHVDYMHLIINMFVLWQFGTQVEDYFVQIFGEVFGRVNYLLLYLLSAAFGDVSSLVKHKDNHLYSAVGASGGVSGIMLAFVIFNPWSILLLFFIIPMPAFVAAILYLVYSSWASKKGHDLIGHDAHFYGAVFGFLFTLALKPGLFSFFVERLTTLPF